MNQRYSRLLRDGLSAHCATGTQRLREGIGTGTARVPERALRSPRDQVSPRRDALPARDRRPDLRLERRDRGRRRRGWSCFGSRTRTSYSGSRRRNPAGAPRRPTGPRSSSAAWSETQRWQSSASARTRRPSLPRASASAPPRTRWGTRSSIARFRSRSSRPSRIPRASAGASGRSTQRPHRPSSSRTCRSAGIATPSRTTAASWGSTWITATTRAPTRSCPCPSRWCWTTRRSSPGATTEKVTARPPSGSSPRSRPTAAT